MKGSDPVLKITSKPYGEINIDEQKIIRISGGLFGFEDYEKYVIIGKQQEQPFEWLQSVKNSTLAFVIVQTRVIKPDYKLSISTDDLTRIKAESTDNLTIYSIVVVPADPQKMTVNLRGPLIINRNNFLGKQVINQVDDYTVRHQVLDVLKKSGKTDLLREGGPG